MEADGSTGKSGLSATKSTASAVRQEWGALKVVAITAPNKCALDVLAVHGPYLVTGSADGVVRGRCVWRAGSAAVRWGCRWSGAAEACTRVSAVSQGRPFTPWCCNVRVFVHQVPPCVLWVLVVLLRVVVGVQIRVFDSSLRLVAWFEDMAAGPVTSISFAAVGGSASGGCSAPHLLVSPLCSQHRPPCSRPFLRTHARGCVLVFHYHLGHSTLPAHVPVTTSPHA